MNFSHLLTPIAETHFFSDYWEKQLLVIQGRSHQYYDELLTVKDIDHILTSTWLRLPSLRLVKDGIELNRGSYTKPFNWGGKTYTDVIDVSQVFSAYLQGASIVMDALHHYWKPLALFCEVLTKQLSLRFQSNVYVSPPTAQGLAPHYDSHDVFILQIFGSKHWKFYEPVIQLPNKKFRFDKHNPKIGNLIEQVTLRRGDLVYIPRGFAHEAVTSEEASIHITVGVEAYKWIELFRMAIDDLENDPEFRKALPPKFLEIQMFSNEDKEQMKALLTKFNELVVSEELIEKVQHKFLSDQTPTFDGYFSTLLNLEDLNGKTMIRVRDNVTYKITDTENETILLFADKKVRFPSYVKGALRFICDHVELAVSDIPNVLDESGKVVLARVLAKEGFVHVL